MFEIMYTTDTAVADMEVVIRTSTDNWADRAGEYTDGSWQFILDERDYAGGFEFKFVILPDRWMNGANLTVGAPTAGSVLAYTDQQVTFPPDAALVTENGVVAQKLVRRNLDSTVGLRSS